VVVEVKVATTILDAVAELLSEPTGVQTDSLRNYPYSRAELKLIGPAAARAAGLHTRRILESSVEPPRQLIRQELGIKPWLLRRPTLFHS
jgi:hypothetical protein